MKKQGGFSIQKNNIMLESYHFQNTTKLLSITPYSNNKKQVMSFGGMGVLSLFLPLLVHPNIYFTYFLIFLGILMVFQAIYNYLNINTVVTFNKEDKCIYETFMGKEKKVMTFMEASIVRHTVNNTATIFCLSKNKSKSKRYTISHRYYVKKDIAIIALYQKEILSEINYVISHS